MYERYRAFISRYISFGSFSWRLFESKLKILHYPKGSIIHTMDEVAPNLLFINSGLARAYTLDENGKDYTFSIYFNDHNAHMTNLFVVDYESFVNQAPSRLEIEAIEDCEMIAVEYKDVELLYNRLKKGERFGRLMNQEAYSYSHHRILDLQSKSAKERFEEFMDQTPFLLEKVPQYQIASLLGITPEHLSRLKRGYQSS
ncbi:MAG: Crp/Fnr family transcriptional regulator [Campylobacterota bacterium]|nr:Crp/Fnr family transcriptional regulator [Campylobacterota bacterium]